MRHAVPPVEWPVYAGDVAAILELKRKLRAKILAHNYQDPVIYHGVADVTGDSLAFAEKACSFDAEDCSSSAASPSWPRPSSCSTRNGPS